MMRYAAVIVMTITMWYAEKSGKQDRFCSQYQRKESDDPDIVSNKRSLTEERGWAGCVSRNMLKGEQYEAVSDLV